MILKQRVPESCALAAVVKADAYGLGIKEIAPILGQDCRQFFVATPQEGAELRKLLPQADIFILGGFQRGAESLYKVDSLIPVLNSLEELQRFQNSGLPQNCILHFDTGMSRLGFESQDLNYLSAPANTKNLNIMMVMSHFACADEDHSKNDAQYDRFAKIAAYFPNVKKSLANSSGIFRDAKYHFDVVRPGMALYGLNPTPGKTNPMQQVATLHVPVLQVRSVKRGDTIGYGATYTFDKDTTIAVVALGYADGIHRALSNRGHLYWNGTALPIRGRVSMDFMCVEIGHIIETQRPQAGDMLEIIGPHQSADDLARAAGTIGYEILTSLGARYQRNYH